MDNISYNNNFVRFWEDKKDEIFIFYKGSVANWGLWYKDLEPETKMRRIAPLKMHYVLDQSLLVYTIELELEHGPKDIFWGIPIAMEVDEKIFQKRFNEDDGNIGYYFCVNCFRSLSKGSYMCEMCDYDLCKDCAKKENDHYHHPLFEYQGYLALTCYQKKDIIWTQNFEIN